MNFPTMNLPTDIVYHSIGHKTAIVHVWRVDKKLEKFESLQISLWIHIIQLYTCLLKFDEINTNWL